MSGIVTETQSPAQWPKLPFRRAVIKLGTTLLTAGTDRLNLEMMASLVGQIAKLHNEGKEIVVVSSGAVAAGQRRLGDVRQLQQVPLRQVCAAVGQSLLMDAYDQLFRWHDITIAQALVTKTDLQVRESYLNARNTLLTLMELGVISIVNENDVLAVDELDTAIFGDNDSLSALVANLLEADVLVLLSDIDGLYTADPDYDPMAERVSLVARVDVDIERLAGAVVGQQSRGGMGSKLQAARMAAAGGAAVIIADGRERDVLLRLAAGEQRGTLFLPGRSKLEGRKRWMLSGLTRRGAISVDAGAARALSEQHRSLLPAGVLETHGDFERGDVVVVQDSQGRAVAHGMVNYAQKDLQRIKGMRSSQIEGILGYDYGDEVVHKNNLVLL